MSNRKRVSRARPSQFSPEFRCDAFAMVLDENRPIAEVGRAIGVNAATLGNRVAAERIERGERAGLTADERAGWPSCGRSASSFGRSAICSNGRWPSG